jgi:hypothetical protein
MALAAQQHAHTGHHVSQPTDKNVAYAIAAAAASPSMTLQPSVQRCCIPVQLIDAKRLSSINAK